MGLNKEVVLDIHHLSLSYFPLSVTLAVKRSKDHADSGYKRERENGYEWIVIRITYAESCKTERGGKEEMRRDKLGQRLAQHGGGEGKKQSDEKKKHENNVKLRKDEKRLE